MSGDGGGGGGIVSVVSSLSRCKECYYMLLLSIWYPCQTLGTPHWMELSHAQIWSPLRGVCDHIWPLIVPWFQAPPGVKNFAIVNSISTRCFWPNRHFGSFLGFCLPFRQFLELWLSKNTTVIYELQGFRIRRVWEKIFKIKKVTALRSWVTFFLWLGVRTP